MTSGSTKVCRGGASVSRDLRAGTRQPRYEASATGNEAKHEDIGPGLDAATYTYDGLYRLTGVDGPDGVRTYGYDPVGNRTSADTGSGAVSSTYDRADRLTTIGAVSVTVDGRQPHRQGRELLHRQTWGCGAAHYRAIALLVSGDLVDCSP